VRKVVRATTTALDGCLVYVQSATKPDNFLAGSAKKLTSRLAINAVEEQTQHLTEAKGFKSPSGKTSIA